MTRLHKVCNIDIKIYGVLNLLSSENAKVLHVSRVEICYSNKGF